MKLTEIEDTDEEFKEDIFGSILFIVFIILASLLLIYNFYWTNESNIKVNTKENIQLEATISDIYTSKDADGTRRYYIIANTESHGRYEIEISKSEFMEYRINDQIEIKIKNDKAIIYTENENTLGYYPRGLFL